MPKINLNNKGIISFVALLIFATLGVVLFIFASNLFDFAKNPLYSRLFPKPPSKASTNPSNWTQPTVFAHYYAWYGGAPSYKHWSTRGRVAPNDIDPKFYPTLGAYDGGSDAILDWHMKWLKFAKVDILLLSYWGVNSEFSTDTAVKKILDKAAEYGLKVAFTLEPGSVEKHKESITHIINNLTNNGTHPGLYKVVRQTKYGTNPNPRPLFVFYNWGQHYGNNNPEMSVDQIKALYRDMFDSLRNTPLDGIFLTENSKAAMVLNPAKAPQDASTKFDVENFHNDGVFNYDADAIWSGQTFAKSNDYINLVQVSPGFDNTKIGGSKVIDRRNGGYYDDSWKEVAAQKPEWVVILTFNELGESSQIEPMTSISPAGFTYLNYTGHFPGLPCINDDAKYLCATAGWVDKYKGVLSSSTPSPTPSPTATPSPSPTITPVPTPSPTPTPTSTPAPAPTPTPTPLPTPSPIPVPTPAPIISDTTPPVATLTAPVNNANVSRNSMISLSADASDNIGVTRVEFYVNNSLICTDFASIYSCQYRVPGKRGATYKIYAKAYDKAGNSTNSSTVSIYTKWF